MSQTEMQKEKIDIEDIEIGDIVLVNNKHGYCLIKDLAFNFNGGVMLTMEHIDLHKGEVPFTKQYKITKKFILYE